MPRKSKLEKAFERQKTLQHLMGNPMGLSGNEAVKENLLAVIAEAMEAMNELNWRPWRVEEKIDWYRVLSELADLQQFVMNCVNESGFTYEEFIEQIENNQRTAGERYGIKTW